MMNRLRTRLGRCNWCWSKWTYNLQPTDETVTEPPIHVCRFHGVGARIAFGDKLKFELVRR